MNPPIRPREDVEFLWEALLAGELDWVVSDHACCRHEMKIPKRYFGNIWMAKSGFGGTEYLLPALVSEGTNPEPAKEIIGCICATPRAIPARGRSGAVPSAPAQCTTTVRRPTRPRAARSVAMPSS